MKNKILLLVTLIFLSTVVVKAQVLKTTPGKVGATVVHPSVVLTCTAPAAMPAGAFFNFYRGATAGGEAMTPVNSVGQTTCGFTDTAVIANTKYYYVAETCAASVATGATICSVPSNEISATVPLLTSDLPAPSGLAGSAN